MHVQFQTYTHTHKVHKNTNRNQQFHKLNIQFDAYLLLYFLFSTIHTGYKPYIYMSPLTERMRKRKAFADTELESSLFPLVSASCVTNLSPSSSSSSYSRLSMLTLQSSHLSSTIEYNTNQASADDENDTTTVYLPTSTPVGYQEYPSSKPSAHKIRVIDDAKLANMSQQNNEPLIYHPSSIQHNSLCANVKPKLSFSIESIIGIK